MSIDEKHKPNTCSAITVQLPPHVAGFNFGRNWSEEVLIRGLKIPI